MTATGCGVVSAGLRLIVPAAYPVDDTYANGDVLGRREEPVDQDTHKGRVQAIFDRQLGKLCICHALRHNNSANGDAYNILWSDGRM